MLKGVFIALVLAVILTSSSPLSACEACVFGMDGHYYCKDPAIYSVGQWSQYAPCRVVTICDQMIGGGCIEYCSGYGCYLI